jgi:hypothetical protein
MRFISLLAISIMGFQAFGGGDIPFPFEGKIPKIPVHEIMLQHSGLDVEVELYSDFTQVLIFDGDGTVIARCKFEGHPQVFGCPVEVNGQTEELNFDLGVSLRSASEI